MNKSLLSIYAIRKDELLSLSAVYCASIVRDSLAPPWYIMLIPRNISFRDTALLLSPEVEIPRDLFRRAASYPT